MPTKLNPKELEEARKRPLRKERREQQRQIMLEDIDRNRSGKGVVVIPPPVKQNDDAIGYQKQRVAAYVRVSTQEEEQQGSFDMQVLHYTQRIENNPNYELVDIYKDEGVSGTSVHKRLDFQRMIADATAGKIDLILTKSISRFGRNIIDILNNLRLLSSLPKPVSVEFEMEGILYTGDGKNNLIIAILSALAEMESQQKSEAIKAGIRWRMAEGIYKFAVHNTLGYYRDHFGRMVIEPTEAKLVEYIYDSFIEGASLSDIADALTEQRIKSPKGKECWLPTTIKHILQNEKYCGDALMQKTYTKDFRTHKAVKNTDLNMYFKENHHAAIIDRKKWKEVQALLHVRRKDKRGALLQKAPTRFIAKRVKNGVLQGFFFLDSNWSSEERQQFLKIMDSILKN